MSTPIDERLDGQTRELPAVAEEQEVGPDRGRRASRLPRIPLPHPTGRARRTVTIALTAVAVVLAGVSGWLGWSVVSAQSDATAKTEAVAAASDAVPRLLSYDQNTLGQIPALTDQLTTGQFRDVFHATFDQLIQPNAVAQQASSTATVASASWLTVNGDDATVLLLLDQRTTSQKLVGERIDTVQARVTMSRVDGAWLVSGLDQV
ncbi:hypothetical protein [Pseudonocardia xishanensis]|uniref:Mce-associated membrane protein n=1 Tax=Pseudonocardia xishanensis TaxID=630995 RepID=A0ABP8RRN7_9PSEU